MSKLDKSNILFILGASDPEMNQIESILEGCGIRYSYASVEGERVRPYNAYEADTVTVDPQIPVDNIVTIECDFPNFDQYGHIDHHRLGDAGYDMPPARYFEGSSIGQTILFLWDNDIEMPDLDMQHCRMVAAADHCLSDAYLGKCEGVDPEELMEWRIRSRATFQNKDPENLLDTVKTSINLLVYLVEENITTKEDFGKQPIYDLTLFESGSLPEAPEAAARLGVAVQALTKDKEGNEKLVLMGNTEPDSIKAWMQDKEEKGLKVYGAPERGYAGTYLTPEYKAKYIQGDEKESIKP